MLDEKQLNIYVSGSEEYFTRLPFKVSIKIVLLLLFNCNKTKIINGKNTTGTVIFLFS